MIPHLRLTGYITVGVLMWGALSLLPHPRLYKLSSFVAIVSLWPLILLSLIAIEINLTFNGIPAATADEIKSVHRSHRF